MANRRPLVQNVEGYFEENVTGDTLQTFGPVDLGSAYKIINLVDPTNPQDAATKAYVDAYAQGLDIHASVRVKSTEDFSTYTPAGTGVGATLTSADDNVSHNTQDSVLLVVGNRILVTSQGGADTTPDADNGIYVVTTLADGAGQGLVLTRASDFDQNSEVTAGAFMFVTEGTAFGDTGWVLVTNDPITVDTTALQFTQFSSTVAYTFDQGLSNTAGSIKVELDTAANAQGVGAGGGSSGLEFDANTAAGKLRAAVNATGGLQRTASGLSILLDETPDTLDTGAAGLKVVGLPSLFKVNGTAVGVTVTAANLDTLTNASFADALHKHLFAGGVRKDMVSSEAFSAFDPIAQSSTAGKVMQGRANSDPRAKIKGVALAAAGGVDVTVAVQCHGTAAGALSGATPGAIYYVAAAGGLTATSPGAGNRIIQVGTAETATDLWVQIIDYGKKAA